MPGILWRVVLAVIAVILFFAILPPLLRIIGFPASGDLMLILRVAVAGLALFYVLKGPPFSPA
jgi:hypothetical protein